MFDYTDLYEITRDLYLRERRIQMHCRAPEYRTMERKWTDLSTREQAELMNERFDWLKEQERLLSA